MSNSINSKANSNFYQAHICLIGLMAVKFKGNMVIVQGNERPSVVKTVRYVVDWLKETFFSDISENVRHELANTLIAILENCFQNKRYDNHQKHAKDLVI